jgi:outer membrane receptor protein involved in Fe transport
MNKIFTLVFLILLSFSGVNYAQSTDTLNIIDLSLEDILKLEVYSANKKLEPIVDIPSSIVIISRKEIQENGWQTIEEVLTHVPGMYMINDYLWFGTDNFGVRGFFSTGSFNTVIVMINGVSQKEDWYNSFPLTKINVPVEAIDRIEVIRGPMSVMYGNNAFLGAINIITNDIKTGLMANTSYGINNNYKGFVRFSGKIEKIAYSINASVYGNDGIEVKYADLMSNPDNIASWNLPIDITSAGQLMDHRKYINASIKYQDFYFETSQSFTRRGVIDYYPGFDDGHLAEIQASNTVIGYQKEYNENTDINLKFGYYSFRDRLDYKHNSDTTAYGFNDIYSDASDLELNFNFSPLKNMQTSVGAYYRLIFRDKLVVDAPNIDNPGYLNLDAGLSRKNIKSNWAVYLQSTYNFSDKFHLIAGLRLEQTPKYDINFTIGFDPANGSPDYLRRVGTYNYDKIAVIPRAALLYNLSEMHHLKLMYGMAIREPSIGENMDVVRYPYRPQLEPAIMQTLELNYIGMVSGILSINFSLFDNNVNNLISRTNTLQNGVMELFNTNSGKLQTIGSEFSLKLKPGPKISSTVSMVYQYSKNMQQGYENIKLEYAPEILAYGTFSYNFYKKHTFSLSGYFVDEMETYWKPDKSDGIGDTRTSEELIKDGSRIGNRSPAYFVINANLRFNKLIWEKFYLYLYAYNFLDNKIVYPTTRSNDEFDLGTVGYGRSFNLGIGLNL